jgi:hypothetical protein
MFVKTNCASVCVSRGGFLSVLNCASPGGRAPGSARGGGAAGCGPALFQLGGRHALFAASVSTAAKLGHYGADL